MADMVNHPPHYTGHKIFSRECIEYTRSMNFTFGNAFKYLYRQGQKFNAQEDIDKAIWYINDELTYDNDPREIPVFTIMEMEKDLYEYAQQQGVDLENEDILEVEDKDIIIGFIMLEISMKNFYNPLHRERLKKLIEKLKD